MAEASAILSELTGTDSLPYPFSARKHSEAKVKRVELIPIDGSDYALVVAVTVPPAVNNRAIRLGTAAGREEGMAFCRAVNLMLTGQEGGSRRIGELARAAPPRLPRWPN